jgi:excisionase family DNA binding protein
MRGTTTIDNEDRIRVSISESARLLSIGKRMLEHRIANKEITTVRDGRRVLILMSELRRYARTNHYNSVRNKGKK